MTTQYLQEDIEADEGLRLRPYRDSKGNWTIGYGHELAADPTLNAQLTHLVEVGISTDQAQALCAKDIATAKTELDLHVPWWRQMSDPRQDVFANLTFNMGIGGFLTFQHTLAAAQRGDYDAAANNLAASEWDVEVKDRAPRLVAQLRTGVRAPLPGDPA